MDIQSKTIVLFDLDETLTPSKSPMDSEMAAIMQALLAKKSVGVISGGAFSQFEKQLIAPLSHTKEALDRFYLFPTSGTRFYRYDGMWREVYADVMPDADRAKIMNAFEQAFLDIRYTHPNPVYGIVVEDRGTQVTFSAVGQEAPLEAKKYWRAHHDRREEIVAALMKYIPEFEIKIPGVTSIDVTPKGIDKAHGVMQIEKLLGIPRENMVFIGDALYEGGNDYPVKAAGVDCVAVTGPEDTKNLLREWITLWS